MWSRPARSRNASFHVSVVAPSASRSSIDSTASASGQPSNSHVWTVRVGGSTSRSLGNSIAAAHGRWVSVPSSFLLQLLEVLVHPIHAVVQRPLVLGQPLPTRFPACGAGYLGAMPEAGPNR